jgi:hypothetical protein
MKMKAVKIIIYVLSISILFSACKTSRHAQRKAKKDTEETLVLPIRPQKPQNPEVAQSYAYNWVSYRGNANINFDGKKYQCNYYMVNRIDSIIYLNVNLMGIELARLVATPKEVTFVNKLSNEYYKGDYAFVEKYLKAKADFYTLQAVFNGDETKLKAYQDITVSYHRIIDAGSNRPFFDSFSMSMNNGQRKVDAQVKNLKFNTPGTTSIKIPEGFKEMKL